MLKTIVLYALVIIGIPNFVGLIAAFPLGLPLGALLRFFAPAMGIGHPLYGLVMGLSTGIGCGATGVLLAWLLSPTAGIALPIISSVWALIYYYSRGQDKIEGWSYVAGVFGAWFAFWTWLA